MKFMSTLLVAAVLLSATAPAMAQYNYYNLRNNRKAVRPMYRNPQVRAFNQQRAANYTIQQQQAALAEEQRQRLNNYNPYVQQFYPYNNGYYGNHYGNNWGNRRGVNGILDFIF